MVKKTWLTASGYKNYSSGIVGSVGSAILCNSATANSISSAYSYGFYTDKLFFGNNTIWAGAYGIFVRCIEDYVRILDKNLS